MDQSTLASIMANMLDPVTQREFVKEKILDNHKEMRQHILDLANEAHDHDGVAPMDLSKINEKPGWDDRRRGWGRSEHGNGGGGRAWGFAGVARGDGWRAYHLSHG